MAVGTESSCARGSLADGTGSSLGTPGAVFLLGVMVVSASCAGQADYFPLDPGMSWDYEVLIELPDTTLRGGLILTVESETVSVGGREYVRSTETPVGFDEDIVTHYARRSSDGIYEIHPDIDNPKEYMIMPLPLGAGTHWSLESPLGDALSCTASDTGEVDVSGRVYHDCMSIVCAGQRALGGLVVEARVTEVRSPGIGMVRATTETPGFTIHLNLKAMRRTAPAS